MRVMSTVRSLAWMVVIALNGNVSEMKEKLEKLSNKKNLIISQKFYHPNRIL